MACSNCSSKTDENGVPRGCKSNGHCASGGCSKLEVYDWLLGMDRVNGKKGFHFAEVRFKNTRKEFFSFDEALEIYQNDIVACDSGYGFDVGTVAAVGPMVKLLMDRKGVKAESRDLRKILRKANQSDIDTWHTAQKLENTSMLKARNIAKELKLEMKIGDVEYQGDGSKAIFYYIAEDRIDFRELIKVLASTFKVRIEMRQIGARQEAARIGGIGSCGRELCCSSWLTDFRSVSTSAARYQQLSINPMKLAGQCGKLKCCLNYELDAYLEAIQDFPKDSIPLITLKGKAFHQKTDIFKGLMWYALKDDPNDFIPLHKEEVKKIIELNKSGKKVEDLKYFSSQVSEVKEEKTIDILDNNRLDRFDKPKKKKKKKRNSKGSFPRNPAKQQN